MFIVKLIILIMTVSLAYLAGFNDGNRAGRQEMISYDPRCGGSMHIWNGQ